MSHDKSQFKIIMWDFNERVGEGNGEACMGLEIWTREACMGTGNLDMKDIQVLDNVNVDQWFPTFS